MAKTVSFVEDATSTSHTGTVAIPAGATLIDIIVSAGVLLLSEFAGAAEEMSDALLVNPYDPEGCALRIRDALTLPAPERAAAAVQAGAIPVPADAIEQGLWTPEEMAACDLPGRFGYVRSPSALRQASALA